MSSLIAIPGVRESRARAAGCALALAALAGCRSPAPTAYGENPGPATSLTDKPSWDSPPPEYPLVSAHRGLPELPGYAENALPSLERLLEAGPFVIELDVARSRDSVLFLFHDDDLARLTEHTGSASELDWAALDTMRLRARDGTLTQATIPTLREALALTRGRALLTLDRKADVSYAEIAEEVAAAKLDDQVALIAYDDADLTEWTQLDRPLALSFSGGARADIDEALAKAEASKPVLAFVGVGEPANALLRHTDSLDVPAIVGTFGTLDSLAALDGGQTYRQLTAAGVDVIATDRPLAALEALSQ